MRHILLICLLAGFAAAVHADDEVRCGNSIISNETTLEELLAKCGPPDAKKVTEEDVRAANAGGGTRKVGTTQTETWVYHRGSRAFDMVVTVVDGKIRDVVSQPKE